MNADTVWTLVLLCLHLGLQAAFVWGRWRMFRIDGAVPLGVRVIEAAGGVGLLAGAALIARRGHVPLPWDASAVILAAASAGLFASGVSHVGRLTLTAAFSDDVPVRLITSGPYRWLRHPFYAAYVLAQLFVLAAAASPWAVPLCLAMASLYTTAARREERKFATSALSDEYARYASRTEAFLPRLQSRAMVEDGPRRHRV